MRVHLSIALMKYLPTLCASPNHLQVTKAEQGRQIPRMLTANLKSLILDDTERKAMLTRLLRNV